MRFTRRLRSERGQSMVEYMLTISCIVTFVVVAMYAGMVPPLRSGIQTFGNAFKTFFAQPGGPQ